MNKYVLPLSLIFLFLPCLLISQTSISGIINDYTEVLEFDPCVPSFTVSQTDGFETGDSILIIQMQGTEINTSNSEDYGSVTDLNSAGRYERAVIADIQGSLIFLEYTPVYEYDPAGSVQLVSIPNYSSAKVIAPLLTMKWNGATGGVLAFTADTLVLEADIDVSGMGFRGGTQELDYDGDCFWFIDHEEYLYEESSIRSGHKGEGISKIEDSRSRGRAPQANGGGGGNDHNSGGGGGGSLAGGGIGGQNNNPTTFGCQGDYPGLGGLGLGFSPLRLFMGGGGGAGHTNNNDISVGADGGGIVLLEIGFLVANGYTIRSNGDDAPTTSGDGANGGGAGGCLMLDIEAQDTSELILECRGGRGGNANNSGADQCFGPGGGGAGGYLVVNSGTNYTSLLNGGDPGLSVNSSECSEGTNGAQPGEVGQLALFLEIPQSDQLLEEPVIESIAQGIVGCTGNSALLGAVVSGTNLELQWQINTGSGFTDLTAGAAYQQVNSDTLLIASLEEEMSDYTYRLQVTNLCGSFTSEEIDITLLSLPQADFDFMINGMVVAFDNLSVNADSYIWEFGGLDISTVAEPTFEFPAPGTYLVTLTASSAACGAGTPITYEVVIEPPPIAIVLPPEVEGCAPGTFFFLHNSLNFDSISWSFPGSESVIFTLDGPEVAYASAGNYMATFIAINSNGADTLQIPISLGTVPDAAFNFTVNGSTITLNNTSEDADGFTWLFGDGMSSEDTAPVYTYSNDGIYEINLIAENDCGADTLTQTIQVGSQPSPDIDVIGVNSGCAPLEIHFGNGSEGEYDSLLWSFPGGQPPVSTELNPIVLYDVPGQFDVELTLYSSFPAVSTTEFQYIEVFPRPVPGFSYEVDGLTVTFTNFSTQASNYVWNFGDGNSSMEVNPIHTYDQPGVYNVNLNASASTCSVATSENISIATNAAFEKNQEYKVALIPNPASSRVCIQTDWQWEHWELFSAQGKLIVSGRKPDDGCLNLQNIPTGVYVLRLSSVEGSRSLRVIKSGN